MQVTLFTVYLQFITHIPLLSKIKPLSLLTLNIWNDQETSSNLAMNSGDKEGSHLDNVGSFLKYLFT